MKNISKNKKRISKHLFQEIVESNSLVASTVSEYEDYEYLSSKLTQLKKARIRTNHEMQGEGLRETYVAIGKNWLEATFVSRWKKESEQIKKEIRLRKLRKKIFALAGCIFFIACITLHSYALYDSIKPGFGDSMKCLRSGELVYDDLSKFTHSIFAEINTPHSEGNFSFLSTQLPPELRAMWSDNLRKIKNASSPCIERILIDPERAGIYHIKCEADLPERGNIEFRMQCAKLNGQYTLIALE